MELRIRRARHLLFSILSPGGSVVRLLRLSLFSLSVLALGLSLKYWRSAPSSAASSGVQSIESYWADTKLKSSSAIDLINEKSCSSSERYFLACINGISNAAQKHNLRLAFDGHLHAQNSSSSEESEKGLLVGWRDLYRADSSIAKQVAFTELLKKLANKNPNTSAITLGLAINGFVSVFRDPHTYLLPLKYYNEVVSQSDSRSSALGLILARDEKVYFIRKVLENSPAESAGFIKGDVLVSVNSHVVSKMNLSQISELMKGQVGDRLKVLVARGDINRELILIRSVNRIPSVSHKVLDGIRSVGLLTINKFATGTCEKAGQALIQLKKSRIRGLLLDLRDNPGGQMEEASCVSGLFLGKDKKIFELRYLDPAREIESYSSNVEQEYEGPLAVLVNSGSASASEIVAGALKDWGRAVLVGERTFGKGSFQEGEVWSENESLALFQTRGFYYLPSGKSPQLTGIEPDVKVVFRKSLVQRESDQYWSPLHAPLRKPWVGELAVNHLSDCLTMEESSTDDLEINTAKESLFCSAAIAGSAL